MLVGRSDTGAGSFLVETYQYLERDKIDLTLSVPPLNSFQFDNCAFKDQLCSALCLASTRALQLQAKMHRCDEKSFVYESMTHQNLGAVT